MTEPLIYPVHPGSEEDSMHIIFQSSHNVIVYELSTMKCILKSWFWNRVLLLKDHKNNSPCLFNCIFTYLIPDEKAKDDVLCSYLYYNIEWESEQLYPL